MGLVTAVCGCSEFWDDMADDCELMLTCGHFLPTGTGGGPPNPTCEADPTEDASTVRDECAVFASASAEPGGDGTKAKPYASLGEAVAKAKGKRVRVVSAPCLEAFRRQPAEKQEAVLGKNARLVSVEAGRALPWQIITGKDGINIGIERFGASAPWEKIAEELGLTGAKVAATILEQV